ncbi:TonB-dependent receptor [Methylacidiphilum kamchatkense]|uniref:Outer membrane receptor protein involved in Fe transport n=1 Tax=Methylacidiphilum kamchatkense Kam1 TaxID=1202785 RepID=A0A516TK58_9BACT|nr:TonB-dependent receptor plug domain-containing protein [Methylacidiphilum kamchatkense]QDQ41642.1 outer membrane receptor protein involved in Fe transport [Methylacidiphilum kamchatkense Kam1]
MGANKLSKKRGFLKISTCSYFYLSFYFFAIFSSFSCLLQAQSSENNDKLSPLASTIPEEIAPEYPLQPSRGRSKKPKENQSIDATSDQTEIEETTRTAQIVSRRSLQTINFQNVNELSAYQVGINQTQMTGSPQAEPILRGLPATRYRNGMLVGFSRDAQFGPLMNPNMDENLDMVTGPSNIIFGPQELAGGYLNEITKSPHFDRFQGEASYTAGMYGTNFWNLDFGGPIKNNLAYRLDYFGQDGSSYYNYYYGSYLRRESGYIALSYKPYEKLTIDFNGEIDSNSLNPPAGLNRPTQELINNRLYLTGPFAGWFDQNGVFHKGIGTSPPGQGYAVNWGAAVPIDPRTNILNNPIDSTEQFYAVSQLIETLEVSDNFKIINNSLFEYYSTFIDQMIPVDFWAVLPAGYNFDDRIENQWNFSTPIGNLLTHNSIDCGLEFRYFSDNEYSGVWHSPVNTWDLTKPLLDNFFSPIVSYNQALLFGNPYLTDIPVPSYPGFYFNSHNFVSTASTFYKLSPFYQHKIDLSEKCSLIFGGRADFYSVHASSPPGTPLPLFLQNNMTAILPQLSMSLTYDPFSWMNSHFTYFFGQNPFPSAFGSFAPDFSSTYYHLTNQYFEIGTKFNIYKDKVSIDLSGFYQDGFIPAYVLPQGSVATTQAYLKGSQLQAIWTPLHNLSINVGYAFIDAHEDWIGSPIGPLTTQPYPSNIADQFGLRVDPYVFLAPLNYPFIGFPRNYANTVITYQSEKGLGFSLWTIVQSGQFLNYDYTVRIPSWYTLNARIFYTTSKWEISLYFYNFTDEKYWAPGAPGFISARSFNYDFITPQLPFWVQGTLRIFF